MSFALQFNGHAREYFRVWAVNLCLSLLTVGTSRSVGHGKAPRATSTRARRRTARGWFQYVGHPGRSCAVASPPRRCSGCTTPRRHFVVSLFPYYRRSPPSSRPVLVCSWRPTPAIGVSQIHSSASMAPTGSPGCAVARLALPRPSSSARRSSGLGTSNGWAFYSRRRSRFRPARRSPLYRRPHLIRRAQWARSPGARLSARVRHGRADRRRTVFLLIPGVHAAIRCRPASNPMRRRRAIVLLIFSTRPMCSCRHAFVARISNLVWNNATLGLLCSHRR